jgi:2-keto-4-pentenoate hydratase/2-oxohepta-3-ene-1,7-dioic acid hydratase in catechol pathway
VLGLCAALGIGLLAGSVMPGARAQAREQAELELPRVMRYVSSLPGQSGQICFGLVLGDDEGVPTKVRALSDHYSQLCYAGESPYSQPQLMNWAFAAAQAQHASDQKQEQESELIEVLARGRLADTVLPPVGISAIELDSLRRFVIGVGLNYAEHRDEVGAGDQAEELLVFPKPVVPTGPYTPVRAGIQIGDMPARPVLLLDYEVELGLGLLKDMDLRDPPSGYEAFIENVAFFTANDVSDREPIILDDEAGYTRGKSHPGYLPIGPWMVHGSQLRPRTVNEGEHSLQLGLTVREAIARDRVRSTTRQTASTDAMLRGPWAILQQIGAAFRDGEFICMRDADGNPRYVHDVNGVIPAGSILLTGTPGGTAIQKPGLLDKLQLFVRGGFTMEGAKQTFILDSEQNISDSAYLEAGDRVESWVQYLGRQRWPVMADTGGASYGINSMGACPPGSHPRGLSQP